jgi:hypothetical protein
MRILGLVKKTAGGHHGWYSSSVGLIRKPLGEYGSWRPEVGKTVLSWWQRFINWLKRWKS